MTQLSLDEAIGAAETAIAESGYHASQDWRRKALDIVLDLCKLRREFTADDVWEQLAKTGWKTHEPRALGSVMREAVASGFCTGTGRYVVSERKACHRRPVAIWRSLLFCSCRP